MAGALEDANDPARNNVPSLAALQRARDLAALDFAERERVLRDAEGLRSRALQAALSAHLAEGLEPGDACPVCGAKVGVRPAREAPALEPSAKALQEAREAWERARDALDVAGEAVVRAHRGWLDA